MVAAAIVGAAVVGAAGSVAAGSEAAGATGKATNSAIAEQQWAIGQQEQQEAPYTALGSSAIPQYQALLGLGPQGAAGVLPALQQTPGYQFAQTQGETGIENAASTQGGVTGQTLADLDKFNTGLAEGTYQSVLGDVAGAVGTGQAAASGNAANIGAGAGNISSLITNQGNVTAGIDANTIAGITGAVQGASNNFTNYTNSQNTLAALQALNSQG
jgi:hypothetical protein